jgi:hypothetical protein
VEEYASSELAVLTLQQLDIYLCVAVSRVLAGKLCGKMSP